MSAPASRFAENLAEELGRARRGGHRQLDVAEAVGVSQTTMSSWKGGRSQPDLDHLVLLADALGVSLDRLVRGSGQSARLAAPRLVDHRVACERLARRVARLDLGAAAGSRPSLAPALRDLGTATPELLDVLRSAQRLVEKIDGSGVGST
jgi:transcriptional regulator with XRE-family HTH domain